jgi:flagellar basal body-associated protein FliL
MDLPPAAADQEVWVGKAKVALRLRDYAALEELDKHTIAGALHHFPPFISEYHSIKADIRAALHARDEEKLRSEERQDRARSHKVNVVLAAVAVISAAIAAFSFWEAHRQTKIAEAAANENRTSVAELQKQMDTLERRIAGVEKSGLSQDSAAKSAPTEADKPAKATPTPASSEPKQ